MTAPKFTAALAKEYSDLFNRCKIAPDKIPEVEEVVQRILQYQNRYASIAAQSNVPWYVIAVIQVSAAHPFPNNDFSQTHIQQISVSLDDPDHSLTLTPTGPNADSQETGAIHPLQVSSKS